MSLLTLRKTIAAGVMHESPLDVGKDMAHLITTIRRVASVARRFGRDQSGNYAIIAAFVLPLLVGFAALGAEYGYWVYKRRDMLGAADAAAVGAAIATGTAYQTEAYAVAAANGYANGVAGTVITVNKPPQSGSQTSNASAIEVIVTQPQTRLLSALFGTGPVTIRVRAVAVPGSAGCALALNASASGAVTMSGSTNVNLSGCGLYVNSASSSAMLTGGTLTADSVNVVGGISGGTGGITAAQGIHTGVTPIKDPYEHINPPSMPSQCMQIPPGKDVNLQPGRYCNGLTINAQERYQLSPGTYFLEGKGLSVVGGGEITGQDVTLVFRPGTNAKIVGNAVVDLRAPSTGATAGIVMFGDRAMATGTEFDLRGGSTQYLGGAVYLPKAKVVFSGSSATYGGCTQLISDTMTFTGNSELRLNCTGAGIKQFGPSTAQLVE